jgi:hypothetical protein
MRDYLICCPYCSNKHKSNRTLTRLGYSHLQEHLFLYQRCFSCAEFMPITNFEKHTTIDFQKLYYSNSFYINDSLARK